jgi:sterol desaturase/sphingolipid hydroxylase (fatty acid hydroxylase superfamily)
MKKYLSVILTVGAFVALLYVEKKRPLRRGNEPALKHDTRNLAVAALAGATVNFLEKPIAERLAKFVEEKNFGLVKILPLPKFLETALAIALLDYTLYLWHVLTHKIPLLWNFHRVHHADLDLTVSTAIRFHFGEMAISVAFRAGQILAIGVSPQALQIWQTLLFISIFFHHSNVRLPKNFEEKLEYLIVTPRLHGIHHSIEESEMNSNWSSGLTVWDFLHGTFRRDVPQNEIVIGIEEIKDVRLTKMLAAPFVE